MKSTKIRRIGNAVALAGAALAMGLWACAAHAGQQVDAYVAWDGRPVAMEVDRGMTAAELVACAWSEADERGYGPPSSITIAYADEE